MEFMKALEELRLQHPESFFDSYNGEISVVLGSQMFEQHGDEIEYGTFDNCREWGLTYTYGKWTFCTYEHRNSDEIVIQGCLTRDVQTYGPYGGDDKYDTLFTAPRGNYDMISSKLWLCIHLADHCLIRIDMKNCLNGASDD